MNASPTQSTPPGALPGDWTCDLPQSPDQPGGLVLQNVRQAGQLFSTDVRVCRVWVGVMGGKTIDAKPLRLGVAKELACDPTVKGPAVIPKPNPPFNPVGGYSVPYTADASAFGMAGGPTLTINQAFLFTKYSDTPAHEPGAIVTAARFYPLLAFSLAKNSSKSASVNYIRVDYRIDLSVEPYRSGPDFMQSIFARGDFLPTDFGVKAGLFQDDDAFVPDSPLQKASATPGGASGLALPFTRAEKPLKYEVLAQAMDWGGPERHGQWDNIHVWPAAEGPPPTPGMLHGIHLHWRWPISATLSSLILAASGQPQFWSVDHIAGGPRIDPHIPNQRWRFAVTRGMAPGLAYPDSWKPSELGSTATFADLFTKSPPAQIDGGGPLTLWMSMEAARRPSDEAWSGTFFADGIFFAHGYDYAYPLLVLNAFADLASEGIVPAQDPVLGTATWWRPGKPTDNAPSFAEE